MKVEKSFHVSLARIRKRYQRYRRYFLSGRMVRDMRMAESSSVTKATDTYGYMNYLMGWIEGIELMLRKLEG